MLDNVRQWHSPLKYLASLNCLVLKSITLNYLESTLQHHMYTYAKVWCLTLVGNSTPDFCC